MTNEEIEKVGKDITAFVITDGGKYIEQSAQQEITEAKDELMEIEPYAFESLHALQSKIASIQLKAKIAASLLLYLEKAIVTAQQATHQLESEGQD